MENHGPTPRPGPRDPDSPAPQDSPAPPDSPSPQDTAAPYETAAYDPAAALADVGAARRAVADRLITPWWYHPALGVIIAAILLVGALDLANLIRLPVALAGAVGIGLLVAAYQRTTGLWVDMRTLGPTSRRWWMAYAAVVLILTVTSLAPTATGRALPTWLAVLLAAAALVATIVLGRRVDDAMRAEIRSGAAAIPRRR